MANVRFSLETDLAPERVMRAATDFTDRRPNLWPEISRKFYEVYETSPNQALVREGSDVMGGIWAVERYEWTEDTVTARPQSSNVFRDGTWQLHVAPVGGGRTRIDIVNQRSPKGLKGHVISGMLRLAGKKILAKSLQATLDVVKDESHAR